MSNNEDDFKEGGVIYSNRITEVEDNSYKLYNESSSDTYDINKKNINTKSELELSSFTKADSLDNSEINKEEKLDDDENVLNIPMIIKENEEKLEKEEKEEQKSNQDNNNILLYGNDINNLYPKYIGKMRSFLYIKNEPLITIGPDCKFFYLFTI
jgi:hypothetical protein